VETALYALTSASVVGSASSVQASVALKIRIFYTRVGRRNYSPKELKKMTATINEFDQPVSVQYDVFQKLEKRADVELVPFDLEPAPNEDLVIDPRQEEALAHDLEEVIQLELIDRTTTYDEFLVVQNRIVNELSREKNGLEQFPVEAAIRSVFGHITSDLEPPEPEAKEPKPFLEEFKKAVIDAYERQRERQLNGFDRDADKRMSREDIQEHLRKARERIEPLVKNLQDEIREKLFPREAQLELGPEILDLALLTDSPNHHEMVVEFKDQVRRRIRFVVRRFHDVLRRGHEIGLFVPVRGLGKRAQEIQFSHQYVIAEGSSADNEPSERQQTHWDGRIVTARYRKILSSARLYEWDDLLKNPALDIPPTFRRLFERTPRSLRRHISGLFGQEQKVHKATNTQPLEGFTTESDPLVPIVLREPPPSNRNDLPWDFSLGVDPVGLYDKSLALFGWGQEMSAAKSHQELVNNQRRGLDLQSRALGSAITFLGCFVSLVTLCFGRMSEFNSLTAPVIIFAFLCLLSGAGLLGFAVTAALQQRERDKADFERLKAEFPGFDASDPMLVRRGGKQ